MCGRFGIITKIDNIIKHFQIDDTEIIKELYNLFKNSYNVAPKQDIFSVLHDGERYRFGYLNWGFIPSWAKDIKKFNVINTKSETVFEKKMFQNSIKKKRCLILADRFYEWKKEKGLKVPHMFTLENEELFCFAGIYSMWKSENQKINSCSILTTEPNDYVKEIHHRMPVIIKKDNYQNWLLKDKEEELNKLMIPYSGVMNVNRISNKINRVQNNSKECIEIEKS